MKRGFTLVELLVVVVVIASLTAIVFRLSGVGKDATARAITAARLQRVENALSGYYAAFGTYPPVPIQGSRDINRRVNAYSGVQLDGNGESPFNSDNGYKQVTAACRAQPFGAYFPFQRGRDEWVKTISQIAVELIQAEVIKPDQATREALLAKFDDGVTDNPGRHNKEAPGWSGGGGTQLWHFGVMSFLLPRYLFMIQQPDDFNPGDFRQWTEYNDLPCDPDTGIVYGKDKDSNVIKQNTGWERMRNDYYNKDGSNSRWKLALIPSQAACMRWISNFERICATNSKWEFWGVELKSERLEDQGMNPHAPGSLMRAIHSPRGESTSQQYALDFITVRDGWGNELFYYSPQPYQSYTVWSAGANGKTFPPWVDLDSLDSNNRKKAQSWTSDDMVGMKN